MKHLAGSLFAILALCIILSFVVSSSDNQNGFSNKTSATAAVIGTKNTDLKEFVNKALDYAIENGKEKALFVFNDVNGPFTKDGLYIFAYDYEGNTLAQPYQPSYIGTNRLNHLDSSLFRSVEGLRDIADNGAGFITYSTENPKDDFKEEEKISYVTDVDGSWFLGAGRYTNNTIKKSFTTANTDLQKDIDIIAKNATTQLSSIDNGLKGTSEVLSVTGLTGNSADAALKKLSETTPYSIDCITIANNGTIMAAEPPQYSSVIGQNIADQDHIKKLFETETPQMSDLIETVEGVDAIDNAYPVFNRNGEIIGATTLLLNSDPFFSDIVNSTGSDLIAATVIQKDGTIIYDSDKKQIGENSVNSLLFKDFPSLESIIKRIMSEKTGSGSYIFIRGSTPDPQNQYSQSDDIVKKAAAWTTIGLYGNDWKILINKII